MDELVAWYRKQLDDKEAAAKAAIDPDRPGTHWHWVTNTTDVPVAPGDLAEAQQHQNVSLRTVEEFPTSSVGPLPAFLMYGEEVHPGAGDHIARNDPAAVLADVDAKRAVLDLHEGMAFAVKATTFNGETPERTLIQAETFARTVRTLARAYRHRPGWKQEWEA